MPTEGGQPRRLTWHPAADIVTGWSADGKRVLFVSNREVANSRSGQLYEVAVEGGYEQKVMEAVAVEGAWSPDGKRLAYRPYIMGYAGISGWRQYRGGETPPIWIFGPQDNTLEEIPHVNASDSNPMWIEQDIAFISDRSDGAANLFLYDTHTHALRQLTHEAEWDVRNAGAYGPTIVYESGGRLKVTRCSERPDSSDTDPPRAAIDPSAPAMEGCRQADYRRPVVAERQANADHRSRGRVQRAGQGRFGAQFDGELRECASPTRCGARTDSASRISAMRAAFRRC